MIREIVSFTENIDEQFKSLGSSPKEGLHIMLDTTLIDNTIKIDAENYRYEVFSKRQREEPSDFLNHCKILQQNAWCIDTNKCFDLPTKAIHTCSPFCVAFKREHLIGGGKYNENEKNKKIQIYNRFSTYFDKAFKLFDNDDEGTRNEIFKLYFTQNLFSKTIDRIEKTHLEKRTSIQQDIDLLKAKLKEEKDKIKNESIKNEIALLEQKLIAFKKMDDSDYLVFYLNRSIDEYKLVHEKYLNDKLFVTDKYNIEQVEEGKIFGVSNFMNTLNGNMPFLMHQTASFDINGRISNVDAKRLYEFINILPNRTLPNPLPIFVYKEELQQKMIALFQESGYKFSYKELIESLLKNHSEDLSNYYLLYWINTKDGIVFKDFDFVSKFEYILEKQIDNLFEIKEKDKSDLKHYPKINDVFAFEHIVFKQLLQSKYLRLDYFNDLNKDDYEKKDLTFISFSKFRKAVYDFVYKSQRQAVDVNMFNEMVFNGIKDDIKQGNGYGVKDKLNIWYSIYDYFNPQNNIIMASKLESYQSFVNNITNDTANINNANDAEFAFTAGQVIYYILEKSKSDDNSYQLLEPYLQKAKCTELKQAIANDFARYKHENFSKNFERAAAFVLSYETSSNMKHLLPELLSGVFSKNQLFSNNPK